MRVEDFFGYIQNIDQWVKLEEKDREMMYANAGAGF